MIAANRETERQASQDLPRSAPLCAVRSVVHDINAALDGLSTRVSKLLPPTRPNRVPFSLRTQPKKAQRPVNFRGSTFAAAIPGDTVVEQVLTSGVTSFLNLYNTVLIGRIILTWFPSAPPAIVSPLSTVTDPYLNLFRGIIPPLGGTLDLSPILAFVVLDLFTNAAAALPCELANDEQNYRERRLQMLSPSQAMLAFRKRRALERQRRKGKDEVSHKK